MIRRLIALAVALLLLGACAGDTSTGSGDVLDFDQSQQEQLGATTTTAAGDPTATTAVTETTPPTQATQATTATTSVQTTLPPAQQQVTIEVTINEGSPYFVPGVVSVLAGSKVRFTNASGQPRSVIADNGAFDSGQIPVGGVWIYVASTPGTFNYSDGTRPFAVGSIEVQ